MLKGKPWTRDELILAFNLYCGIPFGRLHAKNPVIIEVANKLGRTPGSVAMKLCNLASLDPIQKARGIKGLSGASREDQKIWNEFHEDWNGLALKSESVFDEFVKTLPLTKKELLDKYDDAPQLPLDLPTEGSRFQKVRLMQKFFRRTVLNAYGSVCCITGNPVPELLVASHILPWSAFPKHRVDPANGLCLVAHFDKAFDRRLITFDAQGKLLLSPSLQKHLPNPALEQEFFSREGQFMTIPERFGPNASFLEHHRKVLFIAN